MATEKATTKGSNKAVKKSAIKKSAKKSTRKYDSSVGEDQDTNARDEATEIEKRWERQKVTSRKQAIAVGL
jgi:hypothetical protein